MRSSRWLLLLAILWLTLCSACRPRQACEDAAGCARIPPGEPLSIGLTLPADAADCPAREEIRRAAILALLDFSGLPDHPTRLALADVAQVFGEDTLADALSNPTLAGIIVPDCGPMVETTRKTIQDAAVPVLFVPMPAGQINALAAALEDAFPERNWQVVAGEADLDLAHRLCASHAAGVCDAISMNALPTDAQGDVRIVLRPRATPWRLASPMPESTHLVVWDDQSLRPYAPPLANTPALSLVLQPAGWTDFAARYHRQYGQTPGSPLALGIYQETTRLLDTLATLGPPAAGDWLIPRQQFDRQLKDLPQWNPSFSAQLFLTLNGQLIQGDN